MRILLAEDDLDVLDVTTYALRKYGHEVVAVTDGAVALQRWETERADVVLLDVNLPGVDGLTLCREIRQRSTTPIIMVTAMSDEEYVVRGFESGADDYLVKPFSYKELAMRINAVAWRHGVRRSTPGESARVYAGGISVDLSNFEVRVNNEPVRMTRLETRILYFLVSNAGRVLPTDRLIELVWNYDGGDSFALKTHISHIRQKLGINKGESGYISSTPNVGYRVELAPPRSIASERQAAA